MTKAHRVYHWKHGWIPLDHPAAVEAISHSAAVPDRAAGRVSGAALRQAHARTDSRLQAATLAHAAGQKAEFRAGLNASREADAARVRLTHTDIAGATHVRDRHGWHEVVRVNPKSVTVKTPHSWTDTIAHDKVLEVRKPSAPAHPMLGKMSESKLLSVGQGQFKDTKLIVNAELRRRWADASTDRLHQLLMGSRLDAAQKNIVREILRARGD